MFESHSKIIQLKTDFEMKGLEKRKKKFEKISKVFSNFFARIFWVFKVLIASILLKNSQKTTFNWVIINFHSVFRLLQLLAILLISSKVDQNSKISSRCFSTLWKFFTVVWFKTKRASVWYITQTYLMIICGCGFCVENKKNLKNTRIQSSSPFSMVGTKKLINRIYKCI